MNPLLLYDGNCALCNWAVKLVLSFDKKQIFRFASLQSQTGIKTIQKFRVEPKLDSIIVLVQNELFTEAEAVFKIAKILGFPLNIILIGNLLPAKTSKFIYQWIAKRRYTFFGKYDSCPIPPAKNKNQFITD
ncbi:MAG: DCC1-like thiol-disulfide oxidoreductase family protein [Bacteroidia bacterium]|nr:DCC1-like thiol-disulfide oxidoreductase family protein [Bacteroidia bacterium]MCF8445509.1 DCC1-like thiol-disulfide oxidoreductase family protein [Bacteroidia bacterium]